MAISKEELEKVHVHRTVLTEKVLRKIESDPDVKESFDDFWNEYLPAGKQKNPVSDDNLVPIFLDYLYATQKKPVVMKWLLLNEINSSSNFPFPK